MSTPVIRAAETGDIEPMRAVFNCARKTAGLGTGPIDHQALRDVIEGEGAQVASLEGGIVGFLSVWAAERFVHHLYVDSALLRTSGVGRRGDRRRT